jgi:hypothetical protein
LGSCVLRRLEVGFEVTPTNPSRSAGTLLRQASISAYQENTQHTQRRTF